MQNHQPFFLPPPGWWPAQSQWGPFFQPNGVGMNTPYPNGFPLGPSANQQNAPNTAANVPLPTQPILNSPLPPTNTVRTEQAPLPNAANIPPQPSPQGPPQNNPSNVPPGLHSVDLRYDPETVQEQSFIDNGRSYPFGAARDVRLICDDFPWVIEIHDFNPITWGKAREQIYYELKEKMTTTEWHAASDEKKRQIQDAMLERRRGRKAYNGVPKRIDWLGDATQFSGVDKATEEQANKAAMPGIPRCETWVLKLKSRVR